MKCWGKATNHNIIGEKRRTLDEEACNQYPTFKIKPLK